MGRRLFAFDRDEVWEAVRQRFCPGDAQIASAPILRDGLLLVVVESESFVDRPRQQTLPVDHRSKKCLRGRLTSDTIRAPA